MNGKLYVTFLLSFKWNVQMHLKTLIGKDIKQKIR